MRFVMFAGAAGLSLVIAGAGGPARLWQTFQELYPSDPVQRQALDQCFAQDPQLDRLDSAAREACLRRMLPAMAAAEAAENPTQQASNFVDLWQAAGRGVAPQNDIRYQEQNNTYIHGGSTLQLH